MLNKKERDKKLADEYEMAEEAKKVIDHPLFIAAITKYRAMLFDSFSTSESTETERRENIYRQMKSLDIVEGNLIELCETGKLAEIDLRLNGE